MNTLRGDKKHHPYDVFVRVTPIPDNELNLIKGVENVVIKEVRRDRIVLLANDFAVDRICEFDFVTSIEPRSSLPSDENVRDSLRRGPVVIH